MNSGWCPLSWLNMRGYVMLARSSWFSMIKSGFLKIEKLRWTFLLAGKSPPLQDWSAKWPCTSLRRVSSPQRIPWLRRRLTLPPDVALECIGCVQACPKIGWCPSICGNLSFFTQRYYFLGNPCLLWFYRGPPKVTHPRLSQCCGGPSMNPQCHGPEHVFPSAPTPVSNQHFAWCSSWDTLQFISIYVHIYICTYQDNPGHTNNGYQYVYIYI